MKPADMLVEIGTEELPPKALRGLMEAFGQNLQGAIDEARLGHGAVHAYASPRRLAVLVEDLERAQEDRQVTQKGPPVSVAFDDAGSRVGMGAGYYDRFLGTLPENMRPLSVGLAHEVQRVADPIERKRWDIPLDAVATEAGWQAFSLRAKVLTRRH